jgi:simple sugar transport system permease protein
MGARGWVSETISTLLLNYVAILLSFFVFGPWKDPDGVNYPQTAEFPAAATLPTFGASRVHLGSCSRSRRSGCSRSWWRGRAGASDARHRRQREAARRGNPIGRYIVLLMFVGGGLAGLAGMAGGLAVQGRLRPPVPGYGYTGF